MSHELHAAARLWLGEEPGGLDEVGEHGAFGFLRGRGTVFELELVLDRLDSGQRIIPVLHFAGTPPGRDIARARVRPGTKPLKSFSPDSGSASQSLCRGRSEERRV